MMPAYPSINMKVLAYCETQRGKKVGNGECWTLAAEGLKDANAKNANGYTYGRKLTPGEKVFPGDIMQFTEAKFSGSHSDGSTWWVQLGVPNHTAVVRRVLGPSKYEILEQNPEPVTAATIDFKDLKSGTLRDLAPATEVTDWKTFQRTPQRHRHLQQLLISFNAEAQRRREIAENSMCLGSLRDTFGIYGNLSASPRLCGKRGVDLCKYVWQPH